MSYKVETITNFECEARRLAKKYKFLKLELGQLIDDLAENPFRGIAMQHGFYKIRLGIRSKGKGKRGGARVVTCVRVVDEIVYLVSIYDKSEQTDVSDETLNNLLTDIL